MTANTRPEHTLLARQNRCLQGVCKCRSSAISHSVEAKIEFGESRVRLLIFHSTHANEKVAARVLSHTTYPAWSKSFCEEMRVRMRAICVRLGVLLAAAGRVLSLRQNMTREPFLERHPKHEMSRYKHVRKQVSKQWHLDRCANCSAFTPMCTKCLTCGTMPGHVACAFPQSYLLPRSWSRLSRDSGRHCPETSDVMQCLMNSYHDSKFGEVCFTSSWCVFVEHYQQHGIKHNSPKQPTNVTCVNTWRSCQDQQTGHL